ncbi:MAG: ABC transporter permease subunit [Rhizobiaceae bacterium]|nr:ABC transporter permease subunit [Rhizobiaceae bacterium]
MTKDIAYVATEMLPEQPAPVNTHGPIAWMRANLFSTPRDSILTVIFAAVVLFAVYKLLPWLLIDSVFFADSLRNCREIDSGGCFAVVVSRFNQLIFGFYPPELYWRPILTFVLMFVAFAPMLHDNLPRKMLWFTAVYPLLAYWLLWGGAIWGPLLILAMVAGVYFVYKYASKTLSAGLSLLAALVFVAVWLLFIQGNLSSGITSAIGFVGLEPVESDKFGGFLITFVIGVTGIVASLPIGIVLALGRGSDMPTVKMICVGFIEFIRGVPLITLLFVASTLLNYFLPPGTSFDLILRVIIMVTLFSAAYMAEVVRGGLAALPRGQYEAADALGLNYWQGTQLIILPQALKISIPGIVNSFIGLFKDTTLVSIIGLLDPIGIMQPIRSTAEWNGIVWELPIFVGLVFFIFCFTMSRYSMYFERKLDTGHRN